MFFPIRTKLETVLFHGAVNCAPLQTTSVHHGVLLNPRSRAEGFISGTLPRNVPWWNHSHWLLRFPTVTPSASQSQSGPSWSSPFLTPSLVKGSIAFGSALSSNKLVKSLQSSSRHTDPPFYLLSCSCPTSPRDSFTAIPTQRGDFNLFILEIMAAAHYEAARMRISTSKSGPWF